MSQPFLGEIKMFGGNFAPRGYTFCDGQLLPIAQNTALFSLLGTIYGGDGRTTFGIPDLRGRVPMHEGTGPGLTPRPLGQRSGQETVTLNILEMPSHQHLTTGTVSGNIVASGDTADTGGPKNKYLADTAANDYFDNISNSKNMGPGSVTVNLTGGSTNFMGGSQPHNNMQPYLVISFIIALTGTFPSRS